ncbi:MAG: acetylglutamate kinase [Candidatus Amulumruptor caecigallinarius]|nr:acetylglutamate kinase [Candidatus Amulumruptor caecigallinarius]MCM1396102.1 acetylglutamate kinase [Candidatus Amulumruptor caecigallinarius]MCM1453889.1 acetylglutamate kinase [bacterium]
MSPVKVFKIGGNVVDNPEALSRFLTEFASIEGPKILVHGGGKEATRLSKRLDIPTTMIEGRRVTDRATLDIVTMVYAGLINKRIVAALQARDCNALGLTGADADCIRATKRPANPVDYGFVGDIDPANINDLYIEYVLRQEIVPVFCAITHDGEGNLLNCNADSVASAVAIATSRIAPVELIYCFEKPGVLRDVNDESSIISIITPTLFASLKEEGVIADGMIPKITNALAAIERGVESVTIKHSDNLLRELGTTITA